MYFPIGDASEKDLHALFDCPSEVLAMGHMNAHHPQWDVRNRVNLCGRVIANLLDYTPDFKLLTPRGLTTRTCPTTSNTSTIDLAFGSPGLTAKTTVRAGPCAASDHRSIVADLENVTTPFAPKISRWSFKRDNWFDWNASVEAKLFESGFEQLTHPEQAAECFTQTLITTGKKRFIMATKGSRPIMREWWNEECAAMCAKVRKLERDWRKDPMNSDKRIAFKRSEETYFAAKA